jgi:hypothetical protein
LKFAAENMQAPAGINITALIEGFGKIQKSAIEEAIRLGRMVNMPSIPQIPTLFWRRVAHIFCTTATATTDQKGKPRPDTSRPRLLVDRIDEGVVEPVITDDAAAFAVGGSSAVALMFPAKDKGRK